MQLVISSLQKRVPDQNCHPVKILQASNNRLSEIPIKALNPVQSTLKVLDLSGNRIGTISDSQLNQVSVTGCPSRYRVV